jgi:hypothetical protein
MLSAYVFFQFIILKRLSAAKAFLYYKIYVLSSYRYFSGVYPLLCSGCLRGILLSKPQGFFSMIFFFWGGDSVPYLFFVKWPLVVTQHQQYLGLVHFPLGRVLYSVTTLFVVGRLCFFYSSQFFFYPGELFFQKLSSLCIFPRYRILII